MSESSRKRVIRATEGGWEGVVAKGYRPGAATGVERHTIVGARKATPNESGPAIEVRYFELQRGAASRLEKHEHEHFVIVKRGIGYAVVDTAVSEIAANDVVYVAPMEMHQFVNRGDQPFGFYCIVEAARDYVQEPSDEDLARLKTSPAGKVAKPDAVPFPQKR
ncbi:MAG TPA: cupin domain-containing protein [Candidatus Rubrimentiphilum sp.]|nr:cupin domain-containing protein [Candidatus Rubrimentiphilum sp.]